MNTVTEKKHALFKLQAPETSKGKKPGPAILVVGEVSSWRTSGRHLPADSQMVFSEFYEVTKEMLEVFNPDIVLSPLLCPAFDCLDLAVLLEQIQFRGRYRVMAPTLPNPKLILAEIQSLCPNLDLSFIFANENEWVRAN